MKRILLLTAVVVVFSVYVTSQASDWQVLQTEGYPQQSWEFLRTANALTVAANDKNRDEASLR